MITSSAIEYIVNELKYEARKYFYDKYNALDTQIDASGFVYTSGTKIVSHPFKAITNDYIIKTLNDEMVNVAMNVVPLKLLERNGTATSVLRAIDKYWNIRIPVYPTVSSSMDIDDGLCQVVVYRTIASLGISKFIQVAKEMLESYSKGIVIPDPFDVNVTTSFRFSSNGTSWHDTFLAGDIYMSISRDGVWGNAIPISSGSGVDEVGAKKFVELSDVETPLVAGKMLAVNSAGTGISLVDAPTSTTGGTSLVVRKDFSATTATTVLDMSAGEKMAFVDFNVASQIDFTMNGADYNLDANQRYTLVLSPNGNTVSFSPNMTIYGATTINTTSLYVMITLLYFNFEFYVMELKEF